MVHLSSDHSRPYIRVQRVYTWCTKGVQMVHKGCTKGVQRVHKGCIYSSNVSQVERYCDSLLFTSSIYDSICLIKLHTVWYEASHYTT